MPSVNSGLNKLITTYKGGIAAFFRVGNDIGVRWIPDTYNISTGAYSRRFQAGTFVMAGPPSAANHLTGTMDYKGKVEIFCDNPEVKLFKLCQTSEVDASHWESSWTFSMEPVLGAYNVGALGDGRLQVFTVNANTGRMMTKWQTDFGGPSATWSSPEIWNNYFCDVNTPVETCLDAYGELCVAYGSNHSSVIVAHHTSSGWEYFDIPIIGNPPSGFRMVSFTFFRNREGHLEIIGQASNGQLYHNWQNGPVGPFQSSFVPFTLSGWSHPSTAAGVLSFQAVNLASIGGHIYLLIQDRQADQIFSTRRTDTYPYWSNWGVEGVNGLATSSFSAVGDAFFPNLIHVLGTEVIGDNVFGPFELRHYCLQV